MLVRRLLVIAISLILGAIVTVGLVRLVLGTTVAEYGLFYFSMTTFFLGAAAGIWLDKFLGSEFLPE